MFKVCSCEIIKFFLVIVAVSSLIDLALYRLRLYLIHTNNRNKVTKSLKKLQIEMDIINRKKKKILSRDREELRQSEHLRIIAISNIKLLINLLALISDLIIASLTQFVKLSFINHVYLVALIIDAVVAIIIITIFIKNRERADNSRIIKKLIDKYI